MQWFNPFEDGDNGGGGGGSYVLPTATNTRLGGVKIGEGIAVENDGTISQNSAGEKIDSGVVTRYNYVDYTSGNGGEIFNDYINNKVAGDYAHAEGSNNKALGNNSHVEGNANAATAANTHAEGAGNTVSAANAHVEGYQNSAQGLYSHAEGWGTEVYQNAAAAHVEGYNTKATTYAHAEGNGSIAGGQGSHAENEGYAKGISSHAEGKAVTEGIYAHAEGESNTATGRASHTEGYFTSTTASYAHAEGNGSSATAEAAHAEGIGNHATGLASHAEGYDTEAIGNYSHASNYYTVAQGQASTAIGKYNSVDKNEKYAFIIGNGTGEIDAARSNAFAVDWDGKIYVNDSAIGKDISELVPYEAGSGITLTPSYIFVTNDDRYDFSTQANSVITDGNTSRTFTKVNNKPAIGVVVKIWNQNNTTNTVPIFISEDESAVEVSVTGQSNNMGETFTYKGRTLYITSPNNGILNGTIDSGNLILYNQNLNYPFVQAEVEKMFLDIGANFEDQSTVISCDAGPSILYEAGQGINITNGDGTLVSNDDNYNFDYQVSCTIGGYNRTFTKANSKPAIGFVVRLIVQNSSAEYSAPMFISGDSDAVTVYATNPSYTSTAINYEYTYLGKPIYVTFPGEVIEVFYGTTVTGNLIYYNPNGSAISWVDNNHYRQEDITNILADLGAYWDGDELIINNTGVIDIDYLNNNLQKTIGNTTSTIVSVDTAPTQNSINLITSGAVYSAINSVNEFNTQLDTSIFTPVYNTSVAYGNYGSDVAARLNVTDEAAIATFASGGWNQVGVPIYSAENVKGAYAGYMFGEALNISTVKIWLQGLFFQGTQITSLIATVQYLDENNQWIDFDDCVATADLPSSYIFVLNLNSVGPIYGVRWYHYKDPVKSSANNLAFYGMTLYTSVGNELTLARYSTLSQAEKMNGTTYYIVDTGAIYKNDTSYGSQDLIAEKEATTTATSAHAVRDLFIQNNKLLKATMAIAVSDTIDNSNTVETTINTEFNEIASRVYGTGIALTTGQDLDTITTLGPYNANTAAIAQSLTNCPSSKPFRMEVSTLNGITRFIQKIFEVDSTTGAITVYMRMYTANGWLAWNKFEGTVISI